MRLMRIAPLVAALQVLVAMAAFGERTAPNILLLVAEDMSPRVGAFGDEVAETPNLDALAKRGVRYPNTFTTAGVCAPSRAALITGLHQNALGAGHMRSHGWSEARYMAVPPPEVKAFPEYLRRGGYFTYATSKLDYQFSRVPPGSGPESIWDAESIRAEGVSWADAPPGMPFFGMLAYNQTHESAIFPRDVWPRSVTHLVLMVLQTLAHWDTDERITPQQVSVPPYYPDTPTVRKDIARHYNNIITMDREVGALLEKLERDGLAEDTIVIWTTDHGDGLPRAKRELKDSGTRVPLIIVWPEKHRPPRVEPGSVDERLVSFVDLGPIILQMAGLPVPDTMHGRAVIGETPAAPRRYVYAARDRTDEVADRQRSVRDARYRYIRNHHAGTPGASPLAFRDTLDIMRELWRLHETGALEGAQRTWFEPRPGEELYDTRADPHEIQNLVDDPSRADVLARLRLALDDWQARVPDLGALPEAELAERSWPGGEQPVTAVPTFSSDGQRVSIDCPTRGASLEFRWDDEPWRIYTVPLAVRPRQSLEARAVRYGFELSAVASWSAE